ncbi:MAG TPA: MFS transporter [Polyangiaceae bacterium]|jgi:MFS family permease
MSANAVAPSVAEARFLSDVPPRLDRLPWSAWHWRVVTALGITWMLDGLEVTLVGALGGVLQEPDTLGLSAVQIGGAGSAYLAGAILGALLFGRMSDRFGRKRLFFVTLAVYLAATLGSACAWNFASFAFFRALTGAGIGGEYSAINSTIDELLPARVRGRADLTINATYWIGTALGAGASLVLLDARVLPHSIGWRLCFALGAVLSSVILFFRRHLPESPRWLLLHGRQSEAHEVVAAIEAEVGRGTKLPEPGPPAWVEATGSATLGAVARVLFLRYPRRALLGLSLMVSQAFMYNGVFFTYALLLGRYYGVPSSDVGLYLLPFAAGNLLGPVLLGHLFDTVGRRPMIVFTYGASGVLLAVTGFAFAQGWLTAASQTALWCAVFFVASAAASSAYLTVSELFPVELRGLAIALFYATGTAVGGLAAPAVFGALIQSGARSSILVGYLVGGGLMVAAAMVAARFGVAAEQKSLEHLVELD